GRFLCTHPLGLSSGLSFCSVLAFPTLSDSLGPDFLGAFQVLRFRAFPFRRFRLYQKFATGFPGFEV
ncbi:hypothetical protein ACFWBC_04560, partial [Streptomyces sp. NPDC059985]|uniref:hypothetical protein n=1 Tax=Streptomyces sp. NPDC059985 TaxID=3347025 RepID=UPI00367CA6A6